MDESAPVVRGSQEALRTEERKQADLLRHIFGNPFAPIAAPADLPDAVVQLADALYRGSACGFALHDALLEAGCLDLAAHFTDPAEWHPEAAPGWTPSSGRSSAFTSSTHASVDGVRGGLAAIVPSCQPQHLGLKSRPVLRQHQKLWMRTRRRLKCEYAERVARDAPDLDRGPLRPSNVRTD